MTGEDRRRQILNVAIRLFSQHGFRGATTKEIAQAAGVSEAIIFRHFATKEELYAAILDYKVCGANFGGAVEELAKEGCDDIEIFTQIGREFLRQHREDIDFFRLLLFSALEGHELSRMFRDKYVRQKADAMCALISERQRAGRLRDADPHLVARAFAGMIAHHSMVQTLFDPENVFLEISDEEAARAFAEILVRGVGAEKSVKGAARKNASHRKTSGAKNENSPDGSGLRKKSVARRGAKKTLKAKNKSAHADVKGK